MQLSAAARLGAWRRGGRWTARRRFGCSTSTMSAAAPSRMDYAKLNNLNGVYIRQADDDRLTSEVLERLAHRPGLSLGDAAADRIRRADAGVEGAGKDAGGTGRLRGVPGPSACRCRWSRKPPPLLTPEARLMLRDVAAALAESGFLVGGAGRGAARASRNRRGRKLGQVAQPLRAALTGSTASPGIDATLAALGRDETLARIAAASV